MNNPILLGGVRATDSRALSSYRVQLMQGSSTIMFDSAPKIKLPEIELHEAQVEK